jgi:hypothetical protein
VGQHISVPCQKCHTPDTEGRPRYTGLQFQPCAACHTDPHKGEFKQDCSSCHNPNTWERSTFVATFDHSKTKFPLLGKHLNVACDSRHKGGDFKSPIANTPDCDGINNPSAALHYHSTWYKRSGRPLRNTGPRAVGMLKVRVRVR